MATAKEIEEILGISSRTIDTWLRSRDDKYLLAKYLKSFSKIELRDRVEKVIKEDDILIKKWADFVRDVASNFQSLLPELHSKNIVELINLGRKISNNLNLLFKADETLYIVQFAFILPSEKNLIRQLNRLKEIIDKFNMGNIKKMQFIFVTRSGVPEFITKNNGLVEGHEVSILNIDEITEKLYGQKMITMREIY